VESAADQLPGTAVVTLYLACVVTIARLRWAGSEVRTNDTFRWSHTDEGNVELREERPSVGPFPPAVERH